MKKGTQTIDTPGTPTEHLMIAHSQEDKMVGRNRKEIKIM